MLGNHRLSRSLEKFSDKKRDRLVQFSGILGLNASTVQVPGREGYVYVRIRDNQNEVIIAYNDKVSPVYNLPVIIEWDVSRYIVLERDLERYQLWGTNSPYLPLHGSTHSFSDWGHGGDVTWVYSRQFMPLLAVPSGSSAGGNAVVYPYIYQYDETWKYLNITGTPSLISSLPTGAFNAKVGLLYLDRRNNILGVDFSGDEFLASETGTATVIPHMPQPSSIHYLPIAGVRVVTGTSTITWQNLYDVRPFFGGGGGGGGGGGLIGFTNGSVIFAEGEEAAEDNDNFFYDNTNNAVLLGDNSSTLVDSTTFLRALRDSSLGQIIAAAGSSALSYLGLYRARGTADSPQAVQNGDVLGRIYFNGHDGTGWQSKARWDGKATEDWSGAARGAEIEVRTTRIGGTDTEKVGSWKGNGLELVKALQTGQSVTVSDTYSTDQEDCIVLVNWSGASGTSINIDLHHPTYESQILYVKRLTASNYDSIILQAGDGDTIDGETTQTLSDQYESVILLANGVSSWDIASSSVAIANPNTITEDTLNVVAGGTHTHAVDFTDLVVDSISATKGGDKTKAIFAGAITQTDNIVEVQYQSLVTGFGRRGALFLGTYLTETVSAATEIESEYSNKRITSTSHVVLTSDPQIAVGMNEGQLLNLKYDGNYSVTLVTNRGLQLRSATYKMYDHDWITFMWEDDTQRWSEVSRSSPSQEQTWAFQSVHLSGTAPSPGETYFMGHYRHARSCSTFNPAQFLGGNLQNHGSKVYLVLGQPTVDALTIRISGGQIQADGSALAGQAEDIVIPSGSAVNAYFETSTYWVGTVAVTYISGTERPCNYGLVRAWNNFENVFRVTGITATWFNRSADETSDIRLYHHKATGWISNTGSLGVASPPAFIAGMQDDYGTYDRAIQNSYGSWYRDNLTALISGSAEGLIGMCRSVEDDTFLFGNFALRYRSAW